MPARDARYRKLTYPPTAAAVISGTHFLVGGGGGKAKTGVPNRITLVADGKPDLQVCAPPAFWLNQTGRGQCVRQRGDMRKAARACASAVRVSAPGGSGLNTQPETLNPQPETRNSNRPTLRCRKLRTSTSATIVWWGWRSTPPKKCAW